MSVNGWSNLTGILIGTAFGVSLTLYGASSIVTSGLRIVFP